MFRWPLQSGMVDKWPINGCLFGEDFLWFGIIYFYSHHSMFRWLLQSGMVGGYWYWYIKISFVLFFGFGGSFLLGVGVFFTIGEIEPPDLVALSWVVLCSPGVL